MLPLYVVLLRTELQCQTLDGLASTGRVPASLPPMPRVLAPERAVFTFSATVCDLAEDGGW